ncbi:hypothetical protein ACROYT_G036884 [Oculina patagonica]
MNTMARFRILTQINLKLGRIQAVPLLLISICVFIILFIYGDNLRTSFDSVLRSTSKTVSVLQPVITETDELPALKASSCQPINHIYYLKTHKTASSTIGTMLLSYGINRKQRIVLDPDLAKMQWPALFELNDVSNLVQSDAAKIYSTHIRFNKGPINSAFPKTKAKYITILRNPVDRFRSALMYFSLILRYSNVSANEDAVNAFLKSPNALEEIRKRLSKTKYYKMPNLISNSNCFDMGLSQEDCQNMALVKGYIDKMDREFDLVMVTDYFDESLILLKRLLCWEFEDIVYIKLRVRTKTIKLKEEVKKNILTWNHAEVILFDHFNKTFWRKVRQAGPTFYEELKTFRRINQEFQTSCESMENTEIPLKPENKLLKEKCALSKTPPCDLLEQLWRKRGNTFSGHGCGPNSEEIAARRRQTAELFKFS